MEFALWILAAAVVLFGALISTTLKEIAKEAKNIRRFLQTDDDLKHSSIPANLLNYVEQIGEVVIGRSKDEARRKELAREQQVLAEINRLMTPSQESK